MTTLLSVQKLRTSFFTKAGEVKAVDDVSFDVPKGRVLGLVGESGSGKTVTGFSVLGLVDPPGRIVSGRILLQGQDLLVLPPAAMRAIRGRRIAMVFQDPMMTLNPVLRIGTQMVETLLAHEQLSRGVAWQRARDMLGRVGISSPEERMMGYPHQFSGGMRQRVAIATALLHRPEVIIADEPTTALDVTIQAQILYEMQRLCREGETAMLWITHDLAIVAGLADDVCIMYAGKIVEQGPTDAVLDRPLHPYTKGLLASLPSSNQRGRPLGQIPGMMPSLLDLPSGCGFQGRCTRATAACKAAIGIEQVAKDRIVRCVHPHMDALQ